MDDTFLKGIFFAVVTCLVIAIILWITSIVIQIRHPHKRARAVAMKVIVIFLLIACMCGIGFLQWVRIRSELRERDLNNRMLEFAREQQSTKNPTCPNCGEPVSRYVRHVCKSEV
ncbi:MAG: hypothetical protein E7580_08795 [Ruminococcaceae bacterium]|nr:hypothetical protein [Oscillospiraceae bacterium]